MNTKILPYFGKSVFKKKMKLILLKTIDLYQTFLSPILGPSCRFSPTCSEYTKTAINRFGVMRGSLIAIKRIFTCHPWGGSGYDPVPKEYKNGHN